MCELTKKYKLCTCKNLDKTDQINRWTLTRFIGLNESQIMGSIVRSTENFENGISSEKLILQMNAENSFDFDYTANENDCLHVSTNENNSYKYFKIIYKEGQWQSGGNPVFTSILKNIAEGKIEIK
nr:hypothetical protein [uncultured Flavobacterium sp.]